MIEPAKASRSAPPNRRSTRKLEPSTRRVVRTRRQRILRILMWCGVGLFAALALGIATITLIFWHYGRDPKLPNIQSLNDYHPKQVTRIVSADGKIVGELGSERRTFLASEAMPEKLIQAFISAEDAKFFQHGGLDYSGMVRAMFANIRAGETKQGASTITQQVVKTFLLTPERTFKRKIQEIILARRLEKALSKQEILTLYLNQIYFGHGRYGVQEAARFYFGKEVAALDLGEMAMLAGLPKGPERYSPRKPQNHERAKERQSYVLDHMAEHGYITAADAEKWKEAPIRVLSRPYPDLGTAPEWLSVVRQELVGRVGEDAVDTVGSTVMTTLDSKTQVAATAALQAALRGVDQRQKHGTAVRKLKADKVELELAKLAKKLPKDGPHAKDVYDAVVREVHDGKDGPVGELVVDLGNWRAGVVLGGPGDARYNPDRKKPSERFAAGDVVEVTRMPAARKPAADVPGDDDDAAGKGAAVAATPPAKLAHAEHEVMLAPGPEGALVVLDAQTRKVLAMVGGYASEPAGFNRVTMAKRQAGSTFKPILYAAALQTGQFTPATLVNDAPEVYKLWKPQNYKKNAFEGPVRLRYALAKSINTVAIRVCHDVGPDHVAELAQALGIHGELPHELSLALGSGEVTPIDLTAAFATLVSGGVYMPPRFVDRIDGKALPGTAGVQALSPDIAYVVSDMMRSVVEEGTAGKARALGHVAGKTGTSNDGRDAWFVGTTGDLVVGVWVGFDEPRSLGRGESGGVTALPAFIDLIKAIGAKTRALARPAGVVSARIDKATGLLAPAGAPAESSYEEVFLAGSAPTEIAPRPGEVDATTFVTGEYGDDVIGTDDPAVPAPAVPPPAPAPP